MARWAVETHARRQGLAEITIEVMEAVARQMGVGGVLKGVNGC